ncbi:MAG: MFS transporter [Propionibacteriales bacterium]|nr:MFS transporter [Propionibacteriales bacterium]
MGSRSGTPRRRLGRRERRTVAGAVLLDLAVSSLFAWGVFVPELSRDLRVSGSALTIVFSVGLVGFTAGVLGGGYAADLVSPRRLAVVSAFGAVCGLLGTAAAGSVAAVVVAFGVVLGLSTGMGYACAVRAAGTVAARRGLVLALVVSAYAGGTIVIAPVAAVLLDLVGRSGTFVVLAALTAVVLGTAAGLLSPDPPPCRSRTGRHGPVLTRNTVRLWMVFGLGSGPCLAAFGHAGELTTGARAAALGVSLLSAGNLAGRLLAGPVSDRIGRPRALHGNAALLVATCVVLATADHRPTVLAALLALGTQYGALSVLVPAATADTIAAERLGATYGAIFTGWGIAGLLAPLLTVQAAGRLGWDHAFLIFVVPALLTWVVVALPWRPSRDR